MVTKMKGAKSKEVSVNEMSVMSRCYVWSQASPVSLLPLTSTIDEVVTPLASKDLTFAECTSRSTKGDTR